MKGTKQEKPISDELIDGMLKQGRKPEDINALLKQLTKAVLERAMQGEMSEHLGYEKHDPAGVNSGNSRNGVTRKTLKGDFGEVDLKTPRDRNGEFEPQIVKKNQTRWTGFDDKILSMYARGMTTREIQGHLEEMYQVEVSPSLISEVTEGVMEQARAWQNRPLEPFYGVVFLDALYVKMRHEGRVENRAVYVALGINLEGRKDVLGLWTSAVEGAKFWLNVLTELRNRGVRDIYLVCVDGLKGFPQAIESIFPKAQVQLCIVHLVRASLNYVTWQDRKKVVADLKPIYRAATADEAERQLTAVRDAVAEVSGNRAAVARAVGASDSVLCVSGGSAQGGLYHQCGGVAAYEPAQDHQNARLVSDRRGGDEAAVSGADVKWRRSGRRCSTGNRC